MAETQDAFPFNEDVRWLAGLDEGRLRDVFSNALRARPVGGLSVGTDVTIAHYIAQLFHGIDDVSAQLRIGHVLSDLLDNASAVDAPTYLAELLALIGRTAPALARRALIRLCNIEELKRVQVTANEDLHLRALRVLAGLSTSDVETALFLRDLGEPSYSPICYTALYHNDLQNAIRYCHVIVSTARRAPNAFSLAYVMNEMVITYGLGRFAKNLTEIEDSMSVNEWLFMWASLSDTISLVVSDDDIVHLGFRSEPAVYHPGFKFNMKIEKHRRLVSSLVISSVYDDGVVSYA